MKYKELLDFIEHKMRMQHIYQPAMLATLLKNDGQSTQREIAKSILPYDESQIEYYERITRDMVGRVLTSHGIVQRDGFTYKLVGYDGFTPEQVNNLIIRCDEKINGFLTDKKDRWKHRKWFSSYVSGTKRYEVLKRAKFHCELCGISADEKWLEVDHIIPKNKRGRLTQEEIDDVSNLQALCYSCNAMKRDKDNTDFRAIRESYNSRSKGCIFCEPHTDIIAEKKLAYAIYDKYPVAPLHTLIIPKRHVQTYFDLGRPEINACNDILQEMKTMLEEKDRTVSGFNIGINNMESAGQTIPHCHIHLIPRRSGDVENPRGGVRHILPGKGYY